MKRGGEEIYVGPLGHHSSQLISYFEVSSYELLTSDDEVGRNETILMIKVTPTGCLDLHRRGSTGSRR